MDIEAPAHQPKPRREVTASESAVRDRIVSGARRHFFTHGLRSVTMDDLARELGMSKKTLYAHFPSKTALVEAVLLEKFRDVEAELERITSELPSDVPFALQQLLACFQRHTDEIHPPFIRDIQREAPGMFELVEMRRRAVVERTFGRFLTEGRQAGIIRDDIAVEMMVEILLGAVQALMNPPKMAELGLTLKSGVLTIITVFLEGVVTAQGRSKL
jgi:AcrR family transcriptional regulator